MLKSIRAFIKAATTEEIHQLGKLSGVHPTYIWHLAKPLRNANVATAAAVERASMKMHRRNKKLPIIPRTDLCKTCAVCPLAKKHGR